MSRAWVRLGNIAPALVLVLAACSGGGGGGGAAPSISATGPIKIWYSNNAQEVTWGEAVVAAWNKANPSAQVSGEQIPAAQSSEEVIGAAITAGNEPCLIFNTAPAAVSQFQQAGGLVALDEFPDGASYIMARTGAQANEYKSSDGKFYQMPWKTNPVMIFYNKAIFAKAGLPTDNPPLTTYAQFLATAQTLVAKGGVQAAIWPSPSSEYYQAWFDFYATFIAQSGGKQLIVNGEPQFTSPDGLAVANFWRSLYAQKLVPNEAYTGDSFADQKAAMAIVGPWAIPLYPKIQWGAVPVPTENGMAPKDIYTFSDEKSIGMYSSCKNLGTAWAFLKFATSQNADGQLLQVTGQMPMRINLVTTYPAYFKSNPAYLAFADQASRTVEVPNVTNSIAMWQTFRNAYSAAVIFGKQPIAQAFAAAATTIKSQISGSGS